jgi:predicted enzyme related to lactoylglutathione lyase
MSEKHGFITGPDFIALQVRDLEASKKFWVEQVGLKPSPKSPPGAVVFDTRPIPFAIRNPLVDLNAANHLGWGVALWMHAEDIDTLYKHLSAQGMVIVAPLSKGAFGPQFTFTDIDGYTITVHGGR